MNGASVDRVKNHPWYHSNLVSDARNPWGTRLENFYIQIGYKRILVWYNTYAT